MKRIIPVLLVSDGGLVKSVRFKKHKYIGDPINAVKIFNEKEVDEIIILDIDATRKGRSPNIGIIKEMASEAFMPLSYGGGINNIDQVKAILFEGVEKVVFNNSTFYNTKLISETAERFGSSSTVVSIDVKRNFWGQQKLYSYTKKKVMDIDIIEHARSMEKLGAGELFVNSVDNDGTFEGYDIDLTYKIACSVSIPVIACGGAATDEDLAKVIVQGKASAAAAGSMFVYQNRNRAVLINYPNWDEIQGKIKDYNSIND